MSDFGYRVCRANMVGMSSLADGWMDYILSCLICEVVVNGSWAACGCWCADNVDGGVTVQSAHRWSP